MAAKRVRRNAEPLTRKKTGTVMPNTKPSSVPVTPANAQMLADVESCSSPAPALELLAVAETNCLVPQPKCGPRSRCCTPSSRDIGKSFRLRWIIALILSSRI